MAVTPVQLYELLRDKLGAEEASLLVSYIDQAVQQRAATREDLLEMSHNLETAINQGRSEVEMALNQLRSEVEMAMNQLRSDVEMAVNRLRHDLERRMDRLFFILLAAMIILNGDKVLAFLNALLTLVR